jgi:pimeloyl-ACP methyl ester carboxylesterase
MSAATAPGRLVDVGGAAVHVVVEGNGPTVVLESGLGGGVVEWELVAARLTDVATVVRHDRPGLGWSEQRPGPRTAVGAAHELHQLLAALGLGGPVVLVGHSLGGLHVRAFAALYPDDVAGVVLVDPSHEDAGARMPLLDRLNGLQLAVFRALLRGGRPGLALLRKVYRAGLAAQLGKPADPAAMALLDRATERAADPAVLRTVADEVAGLGEGFDQVRRLTAAGRFPAVPLRVISQGRPPSSRLLRRAAEHWRELHAGLATLSPQGAHVVAGASGHLVPLEQPDLVAVAVREVLGR